MVPQTNNALAPLNREQRDAILGLMLGDGHLETQTGGNSYRLLVEGSLKHKPYIDHLYAIFEAFVTTPPREIVKSKGVNYGFKTIVHPGFRFYAKKFYKIDDAGRNIKGIPKDIHKFLNDRVIAYWYQDDGAKKGAGRLGKRIHTEGFTQADVRLLAAVLTEYGIKTTVNRQGHRINRTTGPNSCPPLIYPPPQINQINKGGGTTGQGGQEDDPNYYILNITAEGDRALTPRILPYVIEHFYYKL